LFGTNITWPSFNCPSGGVFIQFDGCTVTLVEDYYYCGLNSYDDVNPSFTLAYDQLVTMLTRRVLSDVTFGVDATSCTNLYSPGTGWLSDTCYVKAPTDVPMDTSTPTTSVAASSGIIITINTVMMLWLAVVVVVLFV
jgi:hypothetical protein